MNIKQWEAIHRAKKEQSDLPVITGEKLAYRYRRVSSKVQENGWSLEAQEELMGEYAAKRGIRIVEDFCEARTGTKTGRQEFNRMIKSIRENPQVRIIIAEKTDRIYRNLKDYIVMDELFTEGVELHLAKEGNVLSSKSNSHEKLYHEIKVILAKNYIDNLREESGKGMIQKAKDCIYPSTAPIGYVNDIDKVSGKRMIFIDPERAPYVIRAFEMYASGNYSAGTINEILYKDGFRTRKGHKYSKSSMERMLKNIFYTGRFEYKGIYCSKAQHERLVSDELFDIVQDRFEGQDKTRKHTVKFPYLNLIKCGECGSYMTAELKKGRYVYYHCNDFHKRGCKKGSYINQEKIDRVIEDLLKRLNWGEEFISDVLNCIKDIHKKKNEYNHNVEKNINNQIQTIQKRIERLYEDKVDGNITEEFWRSKNITWHAEKENLISQLKLLNQSDTQFYNDAETILNWCRNSYSAFINGDYDDKKIIAQLVLSNLSYKDKKLSVEPNSVFYDMLCIKNSKSTIELAETQTTSNKKAPCGANFKNGGNDEARTRDLMRDRHAL